MDLSERIAKLSPEKRDLLLKRLAQGSASPRMEAESIPRLSRDGTNKFHLSFGQERLWLLDQYEPGSIAYNLPFAVRLKGPLDVAVFRQCLANVVRRHEVLRTTFERVNERPMQVVHPSMTVEIPVEDLQSVGASSSKGVPFNKGEEERDAAVEEIARNLVRQPFDLARGPLFRPKLLQLAADEHIFLFIIHHIIFDAWSTDIFLSELMALYDAAVRGRPSPLAELPFQYADYAYWQRQEVAASLTGDAASLTGGVLQKQLDYWQEKLGRRPAPTLQLPADRPRPAVQTYEGANEPVHLPSSLVAQLKALSQREGATLYMTLLAAFSVLLYRYTDQTDINVGSPIANRQRTEMEALVGFFLNTLVLRTDLSGDPDFRTLLRRVRQVCLEAYANQDVPFEKVVEVLQPERSLSHSPLFQVMFILINTPISDVEVTDLKPTYFDIDPGTAQFDLTLVLSETAGGLSGRIEYNTDLFDAATMRRLRDHFVTLLQGIVADPDSAIGSLPLLTAAEREQLLGAWNETGAAYPRERGIHELFEAQAAATPEATAVRYENQQLSYGELERRANQLARYLRGLGVGPEMAVGICLERSAEMVVGLLGILKAGGAYVPLDPAFPQQRLAYMLQDSEAGVLLTEEKLSDLLTLDGSSSELLSNGARQVCLDRDWPEIAQQSTDAPVVEVTGASRAYVIYTSGSTGRPKGVQISHRAAVNFLLSMSREPGFSAQDTLLAVTTLSFDISVLELFLPLITGGQVVVASREVASDGRLLGEALAASGATVMQATPATWRMMIEAGWEGSEGLKVLCGGEALPRELAEQLIARSGELWNMYGPTETTVWSTVEQVQTAVGTISIGRPIVNTEVYVLDRQLQPVPVGVPGTLYIGGDGLALGYLKRPALTAEKFIAHPFSDAASLTGARLYNTGDVARYLPDGRLEHLGRSDHQVKVRGFRIELGEIEAVLAAHEAVREVVVMAREDAAPLTGDKRLAAYLILDEAHPAPSSGELRDFVRQTLPEYMTPSAYVFLESYPLTPNNKVDRKALPAPDLSAMSRGLVYVAPRTPVEEVLAEMWAKILKLERVGIEDNFFDLGGHSLLATQLIARVQEAFGVEVALRQLFEAPTVAGLSAIIVTKKGDKNLRAQRETDLEHKLRLLESF